MKIILISFSLLLCLQIRSLGQPVNTGDSTALLDLYNNTGGVGWTYHLNWLVPDQPVSDWEGVVVSGDRVVSLSLTNNNLTGTLPASLGNLTELTILDLSGNPLLTGNIPSTLNNLVLLDILILSGNNLSGAIPDLSALSNLSYCELYGNQLTGSIPAFSTNAFLFYLDLSDNRFGGQIPSLDNTGNSELFYIDFSTNNLSGQIPASLGTLTFLETLALSDNQINGNIPAALSNNSNLAWLELSGNQLTGEIPSSFADLTNLGTLLLDNNLLTGQIPSGIGDIAGLSDLVLHHNQLSGNLPASFCTHDFESLLINNNQFTFDGMECLEANDGITTLEYDNQKTLSITNNYPTLAVTAGGTLANNTYAWYKDNSSFATNAGDSTLLITDPGVYRVEVTNSNATQLTLFSNDLIVSILPLHWLKFTASNCNENVCLEWHTDNEKNTSHFEIERSVDGIHFDHLSRQASRNEPGKHVYNATDFAPLQGTNYYRIKQVDLDGKYTYSDVVSVKMNSNGGVTIQPNPASGFVVLKGLVQAQKVTIYSVNGQRLMQWQNVAGNIQLNISALPRGMYVIKVQHRNGETLQKLIKQ